MSTLQVRQAHSNVAKVNNQVKEMCLTIANLEMNQCKEVEGMDKAEVAEKYRKLYERYISQKGARTAEWGKHEQEMKAAKEQVFLFENH